MGGECRLENQRNPVRGFFALKRHCSARKKYIQFSQEQPFTYTGICCIMWDMKILDWLFPAKPAAALEKDLAGKLVEDCLLDPLGIGDMLPRNTWFQWTQDDFVDSAVFGDNYLATCAYCGNVYQWLEGDERETECRGCGSMLEYI